MVAVVSPEDPEMAFPTVVPWLLFLLGLWVALLLEGVIDEVILYCITLLSRARGDSCSFCSLWCRMAPKLDRLKIALARSQGRSARQEHCHRLSLFDKFMHDMFLQINHFLLTEIARWSLQLCQHMPCPRAKSGCNIPSEVVYIWQRSC